MDLGVLCSTSSVAPKEILSSQVFVPIMRLHVPSCFRKGLALRGSGRGPEGGGGLRSQGLGRRVPALRGLGAKAELCGGRGERSAGTRGGEGWSRREHSEKNAQKNVRERTTESLRCTPETNAPQ